MNYAHYLEKGKTIESTESLIEKVINSQGLDENALQELVNRAQSQDSKAIEFLLMLQQQSGVSKFEKPSGPIVKKDQQDPNVPVAAETGTVDGRKYTYIPYQGEGRGPIDRFEYIGQDGNTYGMTIQGPDTTYVMNGQQYNDPEGQRVIKERRTAVVREKCGGSVKKKETGDKITRKKIMAKGGCPCMIKKVGGRLIEVDSCTDLPVHKVGGKVLKFEDGKTIWQKWWGKITKKPEVYEPNPVYINHKQTGLETPVMMTPGYVYDPKAGRHRAYFSDDVNKLIRNQSKYLAIPDGRLHTHEANEARNTLNADRQPYTFTTPELPTFDKNKLNTLIINKQLSADLQVQQQAQAAQAQKVRTFYSKMSDSDKRALQDMLKSAGYYKGEIDGLIGNGTLSALRKFQQDNKLAVDGMAGRNTFDALRAKTRQVAQPVTDPTTVPGYTQAMQLLNQMNGSASAAPVKTGGPTGGMGLNDVHQGRDVQLVGPTVGLNLAAGLEIPQRKQVGQLNYANYLN